MVLMRSFLVRIRRTKMLSRRLWPTTYAGNMKGGEEDNILVLIANHLGTQASMDAWTLVDPASFSTKFLGANTFFSRFQPKFSEHRISFVNVLVSLVVGAYLAENDSISVEK